MDIVLVNASVYGLPTSRRAGAIVYDGPTDLDLWRPPGPDRDLLHVYGDSLTNALDRERKELPGRTVKNYFVPMADEQALRYEDYHAPAARLIAQAKKRPLTQAEFDRLQQLLACMRMVCDTPAILDPSCRISPKLEELERILDDLLAEPDRKVIVFSEWERMLAMVRELGSRVRDRARRRAPSAWRREPVLRHARNARSGRALPP